MRALIGFVWLLLTGRLFSGENKNIQQKKRERAGTNTNK